MTDNNDDKNNKNYDVGYRKPPKSGQIKKGERRHPQGRPKGSKNLNTILEACLKEVVLTKKGKMPIAEVMTRQLTTKAANGDLKANDMVYKRQSDRKRDEQERFECFLEYYYEYLSPIFRKMLDELGRVGDEETVQFIKREVMGEKE